MGKHWRDASGTISSPVPFHASSAWSWAGSVTPQHAGAAGRAGGYTPHLILARWLWQRVAPGTNCAKKATVLDPAATWQKPLTYLVVKETLYDQQHRGHRGSAKFFLPSPHLRLKGTYPKQCWQCHPLGGDCSAVTWALPSPRAQGSRPGHPPRPAVPGTGSERLPTIPESHRSGATTGVRPG